MLPLRARRMRLEAAGRPDARWLAGAFDCSAQGLGTHVEEAEDEMLILRW
jgi:poly-gamma-glutamate synthesis protein (capsule biosynthesis protein)